MADREEEVQDTSDYKLDKKGRKVKAHRIVFRKGEDDGNKGIKEGSMKKTYNNFVQEHTLPLTEEQLDEIVSELQEVLGKDAKAGDWISDFVHSDNPKFAGKSKEKRKQMALAAFYAKQRNEQAEIEEALKGKQHKLDKNKNGKLDAHDFKLLRKEDAEIVDEASHQSKTTMKHVSNPTAGEKKAAKDIKPGIAGYRDRVAMLKSAEARGALKKEEAELDEAVTVDKKNYSWGKMVTVHHGSENSYPLHPEHQDAIKKLKSGEHTSFKDETNRKVTAHREGDNVHLSGAGSNKKTTVSHSHFSEETVDESAWDYKSKRNDGHKAGDITKTKHEVSKSAAGGTVYTKQYDVRGTGKGQNSDFKRDPDEAKRGRGRPKKNKFSEAVEFLMGLDEETFDSLMEEGFDSFMEHFEQLDEVSKATLGSYIKKATNGMSGVAINAHQAGGAAPGSTERKSFLAKANKRIGGIAKAADRLSK